MTLEEIKEDYCKEKHLVAKNVGEWSTKAVDEIAKRYAQAKLAEGIAECDFWLNTDSTGQYERGMDYGVKTIKEKLTSIPLD